LAETRIAYKTKSDAANGLQNYLFHGDLPASRIRVAHFMSFNYLRFFRLQRFLADRPAGS
jgi:hypothetical protein